MTRKRWHYILDEALDAVGFQDNEDVKWGSVMLEVKFEAGREVITIKERETSKPIKGDSNG